MGNNSDVINKEELENFFSEYENYCSAMWDGGFYVTWLSNYDFFNNIKTYSDWLNLQKDAGLINDDRIL